MASHGSRKRKETPMKAEEVEKRPKKDGLHSDPATCNCKICVRSCDLCQHNIAVRFHLYCKLCAEEVNACMADASANDWMAELQQVHETKSHWQGLMFDYSRKCPCHGPGTRRANFPKELIQLHLVTGAGGAEPFARRAASSISHPST